MMNIVQPGKKKGCQHRGLRSSIVKSAKECEEILQPGSCLLHIQAFKVKVRNLRVTTSRGVNLNLVLSKEMEVVDIGG